MTYQSAELFPDMKPYDMARKAYLLDQPLDSDLWEQVRTGLFKAMAVETCNVTMSELESRIGGGELGVLIVQDEDEMVTGVAVLDEGGDGWVDMPFVWSAGLPSLNALILGTEEVARATRSRGVKWVTENEKAASYAKSRGFKQRLVEYVKEVK